MTLKLIEEGKIKLDKEAIRMVHDIRPEEKHELPSIIDVRETQQYGVALTLEENTFNTLRETAMKILDETKETIEK